MHTELLTKAERQQAAKLLRRLRSIGQYHVHPCNPYARYYHASKHSACPVRSHVSHVCLHMCWLAGFMH